METEGVYKEIHARFVVRGEVDRQGFPAACLLHNHLPWLKLDVVFLGFVDDSVAKVLVGVGGLEADARGDLRSDVTHVCLKFEIGDHTGSDLPADSDGQRENDQSEENFGFSTQADALHWGAKAFYSGLRTRGAVSTSRLLNG